MNNTLLDWMENRIAELKDSQVYYKGELVRLGDLDNPVYLYRVLQGELRKWRRQNIALFKNAGKGEE